VAAKLLATKLTYRVDGEAFAAGIRHDIGKLILSASGRVEGNKELPSLIHLADFLCRRERIGDGGGECFPILDPASLRTFGIHEEPRAASRGLRSRRASGDGEGRGFTSIANSEEGEDGSEHSEAA
ncbi:uncharacterized protein METZ01_LOCUS442916, partial [marine metagenome]